MRIHINFSVMLPLFTPLALDLERRYGVEGFSGLVYGRDDIRALQQLKFPTHEVSALSEFLEQFDDAAEPNLGYLREKERQYGEPHLYPMIGGCRFVSTFSHRRALRILEGTFRLVERVFDRSRPDVALSDGL